MTPDTSKFPHDRIVFFSDAVFAIAITLLVIEIKVPSHEQVHSQGLGRALAVLTPLFIGYFMSFVVIALFWKSHLQLCQYIKSFDSRLIWINIWHLFFVGLTPFSTALYFENLTDNIAFYFYWSNLGAIGLMSYFMHAYTIKKEGLVNILGLHATRMMKFKALIVPIVFLISIPLTIFLPMAVSRWAFVLIFAFQFAGRRVLKGKNLQSV